MNNIQNKIKEYYKWLENNTFINSTGGWFEIVTPFFDRNNDSIVLYARKNDGISNETYTITDDSYTLSDLDISGCSFKSGSRRYEILQSIVNSYGVELDKEELKIICNEKNFNFKKHSLILCIMAVNDLYYTSSSHIKSLFLDDVREWIFEKEIRAIPKFNLTGKSKYTYNFDYGIPASKNAGERLIKTIADPTRDKIMLLVASWNDVRVTREDKSSLYALIDDSIGNSEKIFDAINALQEYDIKPVKWSEKNNIVNELTA